MEGSVVPLAVKVASGALLLLIAVVYWRQYGPSNFLWLSDLGLACTVLALILDSPLLASMAAIGVLPLELAWTIDFVAGGRAIGLTGYMFDHALPLYLRCLSLFHVAVPPALIFMLYHFGYDRRALPLQILLTSAALVLSYSLTAREKNINWVFGPGPRPQRSFPPLLYVAGELVMMIFLVILPMHLLLGAILPTPRQ